MNTPNGRTAETALRCPACGRRSVQRGVCSVCGSGELHNPAAITPAEARPVAIFNPVPEAITPRASSELAAPRYSRTPSTEPEWTWDSILGDSEAQGRVVVVRQGPNEPMDFDAWRWIAIPTWGLLLLLAPAVVSIVVWQSSGFFPALAVAVCSVAILRFLFSDRLLQSWHLTAALNGRHIVEAMPVTMARLRHLDGREIQLRLKGHISGGSLMEGDRVVARGSWRSGVLRVRRIDCERTGATIVPRQPNARALALTGLCVLSACGLWLSTIGVPWVRNEIRAFEASSRRRIPSIQLQRPRYYEPATDPFTR